MWSLIPSWRTLGKWGALATFAGICVALLVAWSGVVNVAASSGHWFVTSRFLEFGMRSSVRTHALGVAQPPRLDDRNLVLLGAGHYAGGCAPCHGSPAQPRNPIYLRMLPEPTNLVDAVPTWSARQLFWIVKHGIKYSGMPGWVAKERDDEIWSVIAFVQTLPKSTAEEYEKLASGNVEHREAAAEELLSDGVSRSSLAACARCHGDHQRPPRSRLVPSLAGQDRAYLMRALVEYANGERASGIMQPVAAALDKQAMSLVANYYAELPLRPATAPAVQPGSELIEAGRRIAVAGAANQSLPACVACHREGAARLFPRLDGQSARYLEGQLQLWQRGGRTSTSPGRIMAAIAERLSQTQIRQVSAYFESAKPSETGASSRKGDR